MKILTTILIGALLVGTAFAEVHDFDNVPYAPGFYIQGYPAYATASKWYNSEGDAAEMFAGESWSAFGLSVRPAYYGMMNDKHWMFSACLPYNSYTPPIGDSQSGIGDVQLSAAYWLLDNHKTGSYFSFWLWADMPTGDDEKGLGTGQMNIRPGLAYAMDKFPYRVQASAYYNLRFKNSDTEEKPGDEIWANFSFGYGVNETFLPGLEVQTGWGQDYKVNDVTVSDSKENWFRVGPYVEYQVNPNFGFKIAGMYNMMGKNTTQDMDIAARATWGF